MNKSLIAVLLIACLAIATATDKDAPVNVEQDDIASTPDDKLAEVQEEGSDKIDMPVDKTSADVEEEDDPVDHKENEDVEEEDDPVDHKENEDVEAEDDSVDHKESEDVDEDVEEDVQDERRRHTSEVSRISALLNSIKKKLSRELSAARRHVARVTAVENKRVTAASRVYRRATNRARHQHNIRMRDLGRLRAARSIRARNILRAKKVQRANVNRREKELLLIHMIECRLYQLTNNAKAVRSCRRSLRKRHDRYHINRALGGNIQRVYSGYCSRHSRGGGWARYCTNRREFQQGRYVKAHANGVIVIRKSGMYRLHARAIQYCANWCSRHMRTLINGRQIDYAYKQHAHSWVESELDKIYYVRAGQNVQFHMHSSGRNPYRWHSGNGRGAHSRVQITYMGNKPLHSSMCSSSRGRGWHWYCNNRVERTNRHFFQNSHHWIRVKQSGMYRINARALVYTRGWGPHHQFINAAGRRVSYTHDYKHGWAVCKGDVMWPMRAGQKIYVRYYSNNGHAYHSGHFSGAHSVTQVSYEGPRNKPVASYYCSHHDRHRHRWITYCLNRREFDYARRFVRVHSSGQIRILKSGTYRINGWALSHENGYRWTNARVLINGTYYSYCHTHDYSWNRRGNDFYWRLRAGHRVHVQYNTNGNYNFHNGWTHSRVQISFEGRL